MKRLVCALFLFSNAVAVIPAWSATVPAGTALVARTTDVISTHERMGVTFKAALEQDVVIGGKTLLPAGTPVVGVVESSLRPPASKGAVIVNLKSVSLNGRNVPVQTTGAYRFPPLFKTKGGVGVSGRENNYPRQVRISFRLAQPLNI